MWVVLFCVFSCTRESKRFTLIFNFFIVNSKQIKSAKKRHTRYTWSVQVTPKSNRKDKKWQTINQNKEPKTKTTPWVTKKKRLPNYYT